MVQQLAHAEAAGKAQGVGAVAEYFRVFADGEPASGDADGVSADVYAAFVDEPDDHGHDVLSCQSWSSSYNSALIIRRRASW
ncbi:hypothetical protein [Streptomyces olivoreticuli]|uniref:hypothetical protein n=1 Tax=Streptomyces olivoreticuli TaxID=68246 RepID=UPI0013C37755|nr:hypothetical protein [Streptomyces olivoreticuli]